MLSSLHIRNYVLIDSLDVSFPEGLVIITGQTGAGKSILLGALSLLTGAKADASVISGDADSCVVEALFDGADERVHALLDESDVEWDDGRLLIRRVVARSGRSRSFVNDCPVPVTVLQELSGFIVDIHSQHKSLLLTDHAFQMSVLDSFAGNAGLLGECGALWRKLSAERSELRELTDRLARQKADEGYNRSQWERLDAAHLRVGELEELEEEQKQLANAGQIKESLETVSGLIDADEVSGRPGMGETLKEARRQLERVSAFVPDAAGLAGRLDSVRIELSDILDEVFAIDSRIVASQDRLDAVEERMSELYSLLTRHSCKDVAELIAVRDSLSEALFDTSALEFKIDELSAAIDADTDAYSGLCGALRAARAAAAPKFADAISSSLHFLELDRSVFDVQVSDGPQGATGSDKVQFLFSSTGAGLQDVSKCASGGEISRIMLCLKDMMAKFVGMPTLIFDEIDTGVSGSVADKMGRMICEMGANMQVVSITHLPQVAAKGNAHYVVTKNVTPDGRTVSGIAEVSGRERVMEIARLLSGSVITDAAVANAEALLLQSC